jgi:hypothetical protein
MSPLLAYFTPLTAPLSFILDPRIPPGIGVIIRRPSMKVLKAKEQRETDALLLKEVNRKLDKMRLIASSQPSLFSFFLSPVGKTTPVTSEDGADPSLTAAIAPPNSRRYDISVSLDETTDPAHPLYRVVISIDPPPLTSSSASPVPELPLYRFNAFRELHKVLNKSGYLSRLGISPTFFPKTYKPSALGFKLSPEQLQKRHVVLNQWLKRLTASTHLLAPNIVSLLTLFLQPATEKEISAACVVQRYFRMRRRSSMNPDQP